MYEAMDGDRIGHVYRINNMKEDLYKILCENDLDETAVITALVSRDICCVADFLENGEGALKDMKDRQIQCSEEWSSKAKCYTWEFPDYRDADIRSFSLLPLMKRKKLTWILETLRAKK
jgi:hypothetical protein